jgi:stearoyl-CoA desaturase (delta-9 desaturase)
MRGEKSGEPVSYAQPMTRPEKVVNLLAVVLPPIIIVAAIVVFWNQVVGVHDLVLAFAMYLITGFGVTIGFHRMLTHRSFRTSKPVEYFFAAIGSMSVQGPVINWVADHRKHHAHTDEEGDPHSPHVGAGKGVIGAIRGLFHAHVGWLLTEEGRAERAKYARDLVEDRGMRFIDRAFLWWVVIGLLLPAAIGWLITGSYKGALTGLLWGGLVRVFVLHHVTFSINSICHFVGRRRFATDDESRNVWWLALPSFGEAWHHNHHAFPRSAMHGLRRFELDPSAWVIWAMEKLGLVWDVVRITPERQAQRLAAAATNAATGSRSAAARPAPR